MSASTTSRQRVLQALAHQQPDRVPRDFGGTTATGLNIVAHKNLIAHLDLNEEVTLWSERVRLASISETLLRHFKSASRSHLAGRPAGQ